MLCYYKTFSIHYHAFYAVQFDCVQPFSENPERCNETKQMSGVTFHSFSKSDLRVSLLLTCSTILGNTPPVHSIFQRKLGFQNHDVMVNCEFMPKIDFRFTFAQTHSLRWPYELCEFEKNMQIGKQACEENINLTRQAKKI